MNQVEAINHVLVAKGYSKYRMSVLMGCAPISIGQWLTGTKMSEFYRGVFAAQFEIHII